MIRPRLAIPLFVLVLAAIPSRGEVAGERDVSRLEPAVRIHWRTGTVLPDRDGDGVPDSARELLTLVPRVEAACRAAGLGSLPDDGDGEFDAWIAPEPVPEGSVAVPPVLALHDPAEFRAEAALRVARAILATRSPGAPAFWAAPTACWIAREVTGDLPRSCGDPALRWSHPEPGVRTANPLLAAANLALLDSLGGRRVVQEVLRETWRLLADDPADPVEAVEGGLRRVVGTDLAGLLLRSGIARLATGELPSRWAARVGHLPELGTPLDFPVHPLGGALVRIVPDPRFPAATTIEIEPAEGRFRVTLLARRREGGLDRADLRPDPDDVFRAHVPWHDYDEAYLLLVRERDGENPAEVEVRADAGNEGPPFELASFSATGEAGGTVLVEWRTSREEGVAGWLIERSEGAGPWKVATPIPLPPLGILTGGGTYLVPDTGAPAEGSVRWRLVAILAGGLRWTGPVVSLRP